MCILEHIVSESLNLFLSMNVLTMLFVVIVLSPFVTVKIWCEKNKVIFAYYKKPMNSKFTIPVQSEHSWNMKMGVLHREGVRRLLNMDRLHP